MENRQGNLRGRVRIIDDKITLNVEVAYEAVYMYEIVDRDLFVRCAPNFDEEEMMGRILPPCIAQSVQRIYRNREITSLIEDEEQTQVLNILTDMVNDSWRQMLGIRLSGFRFQSILADPDMLGY